MPEQAPRSFTIDEVVELGFEAYHHAEKGGVWWLFHGVAALRSDAVTGQRTLVFDLDRLPRESWYPTHWGEQELRRAQADDPAS